MSAAQRTVFMWLFGRDSLILEDYCGEHPISWKQFRIAVRETKALENIPVRPPATMLQMNL